MISIRTKQTGFTIVELLIVIVVIGILAAITIVAYNGIQTRAENMKTINAVAAYAKALQLYAVDNGKYPIQTYACLGSQPTTSICGNVSATNDTCFGGRTSVKSSFENSIRQVISGALPQPSTQSMNCGGNLYGGAWYHSNDGISTAMRYYLKGNQPCDGAGLKQVNRMQADDTTACHVVLPAI